MSMLFDFPVLFGGARHCEDGLLLVGHGTKSERGKSEFFEIAEMTAKLAPRLAISPCFLEKNEPSIANGVKALEAIGAWRIVVSPLLLFEAGHAKKDIPEAASAAASSSVQLLNSGPLGCHERLVDLSTERYHEALQGHEAIQGSDAMAAADTLLLLVGRGSRDLEAERDIRRFLELRVRRTPVGFARIGFLAMSEPGIDVVLPQIAAMHFRRVVVQPHLLFDGVLLKRLHEKVEQFARQVPGQQWLITQHLGSSQRIAEAIADRCLQAIRVAKPQARA